MLREDIFDGVRTVLQLSDLIQQLVYRWLQDAGQLFLAGARSAQCGCVIAVGLVAASIGAHILSWQQPHGMAKATQFAGPVVSHTARLDHDVDGRMLDEEAAKLLEVQAMARHDMSRAIGAGEFNHVLCEVYGDERNIHDGLPCFLSFTRSSLWHTMPEKKGGRSPFHHCRPTSQMGRGLSSNVRAMENKELTDIRLCAQVALWGCVPQSLRAFSASVDNNKVRVRAIFDQTATDEDKELLSEAATEIIANYAEPYTLEEEYLVVPVDQRMSHLSSLIFLRHEP